METSGRQSNFDFQDLLPAMKALGLSPTEQVKLNLPDAYLLEKRKLLFPPSQAGGEVLNFRKTAVQ